MLSAMPLVYVPPTKIGKLTQEEIDEFLIRPWNARLATITPQNTPYVVPVWYHYNPVERLFYVISRERAEYVAHILHNPAVALHIADDIDLEHTRVLIEGRAHIVAGPLAPEQSLVMREMIDDMARRYMGEPGPTYARHTLSRPRYLIAITPQRWQSWSGGEWAGRYWK
jgi:nitroimidazol reductase NimA-like FMN-containing flavoprotein (pyridoxamine 5'-phosphate oxidase superfamily)